MSAGEDGDILRVDGLGMRFGGFRALHGITAETWPEAVDAMTLEHGTPLSP